MNIKKVILIATKNMGKFYEFKEALAHHFDQIYSLSDFHWPYDIKENETSYVENAMKKARIAGEKLKIPSLADDSGLEVDYLNGKPGITSARYGRNDEERIGKLLNELEGVPWEERTAKFRAYLALYIPEMERHYIFYGELRGYIGFNKRPGYGFGFDPIFYVPFLGKYLSELTISEKNDISHRGNALKALKKFLRNF
ncbi:MAG: RdgB/HAM1 family non-canonical purine NTP pyrophosphatase [Deltaproteobacteria bacterium]|nr:RdgB/HAM1 family non-canonical purine NTP pyrophosphatase [Deltaproteobacteria bacterium]